MDTWLAKPVWEVILFTGLYSTTMILAILGNLTLLLVVTQNTTGRLKNVTNIFICNLALSDLLIALLVIPYRFCEYVFIIWPLGSFLCLIMPAAEKILFTVAIFQMLAIAGARYVAIVHPMKEQLQERGAFTVIAAVWILSVLCNTPLFIKMHTDMFTSSIIPVNECRPKWDDGGNFARGYYVSQTVIHAIPLFSTLVIYAAIYYHMKFYRRRSRASSRASRKSNQNVIDMLMVMLLLSIICWLPYSTIVMVLMFRALTSKGMAIVLGLCKWFAIFNSCHNPVVCIAYSKSFRFGFFYLYGIKNNLVLTELERIMSRNDRKRPELLSFKFRNDSISSLRRTNTISKTGCGDGGANGNDHNHNGVMRCYVIAHQIPSRSKYVTLV